MGRGISKMEKQELMATVRDRYRASSKREKSRILDEFIPELTSGGDRPPSQAWHQAAGAVRQRLGAAFGGNTTLLRCRPPPALPQIGRYRKERFT